MTSQVTPNYLAGNRRAPWGVPRVARVTSITAVTQEPRPVGRLLRDWRERRRVTQLDLAPPAQGSAPHLSLVQTRRAPPPSEMVPPPPPPLDAPPRPGHGPLPSGVHRPHA